MKKNTTLLLSLFLLFSANVLANSPVSAIRVGETNPSTSAYVFGTGEQLSGQQFQTDGIKTYQGYQYTVYYNSSRNVCISRRKMPVGAWEEVVLPYKNSVDDAHNVIVMGICEKDGSIHLSFDHHNDNLHYCYSIAGSANDPENMPWKAGSFSATTNIMDRAVPDVTYPRFISKPDGNLLFECRFHYSGYGDSYLREYDGDTKKWTLIGRYVQGMDVHSGNPLIINGQTLYTDDACAYINGMTYDKQGRLHVTWCWRDNFGGMSNHDFYYAYSEDHGRTWKDTKGEDVATTEYMQPVVNRVTGTGLTQWKREKLMIEAIPYNRGYINQETQDVDSKGRIHAVNSHIPAGVGDDSNWGNSRAKARLHHRFRDTDGTWKKIQIKKNGNTVHSYCRVNLSFDAFDNAYVVANGAEVYAATDANNYQDWDLVSDADNGRFLSEPLVDRPLLRNDGVLSFAYLGADKKITVIDYLTRNPQTPSGTGLLAEYFSDADFTTLISSEVVATPDQSTPPAGTQSIRWSGAFETLLGEQYTLHLNTSGKTSVYVNNRHVAYIHPKGSAEENSFLYPLIPSHKNNLIIEVKGADPITLSWSGTGTSKERIPSTSLYPEKANDGLAELIPPTLEGKEKLDNVLLAEKKNINTTGKSTF
ncbi:BNR repeat-containing protein, partial [Bacteroidales bacterium OttesenSCG-928-L03]|nr:BNR repeat-containing protein [Bacteroidales bacterium OttesenSCG-928-L03]